MPATEVTVTGRQLTDISVIFDAAGANTEFREAVQSFQFVPSTSIVTAKGGRPGAVFTGVAGGTWQLNMKLLQDIEKATSLVNYLNANAGKTKTVDFIPNGGAKVSATIVIAPVALGGDIDAFLDATLSMGVKGAPVVSGTTA